MRAEEIQDLPAGSVVRINDVEWVRMADSDGGHIRGCICNPKDGDWMKWSHLCFLDDEVTLIRKGATQ